MVVAILALMLAAPAQALPGAGADGAGSASDVGDLDAPSAAGPAAATPEDAAFAPAGSYAGPQHRGTVLTGTYAAPCLACQTFQLPLVGTIEGTLVSSVSFANGFDPATNGIDGYWFDLRGLAGSPFVLEDGAAKAGSPWAQDVRFFAGPADTEDRQVAAFDGPAMPKAGVVPAGANYAFTYARQPTADAVWPAQPRLTIGSSLLPPPPPQAVSAEPGVGSALVSWEPPATDAAVSGYIVRFGTASGVYTSSLTASASPLEVSGLKPNLPHFFVVSAANSAGPGPASEEASTVPLEGVPSRDPTFSDPVDGAVVGPDAAFSGTFVPGVGGSAFDNTHYLFLLNLNGECGDPLGYGDHVITAGIAAHAVEALGVPAENIWVFNEDGRALKRSTDPAHFDRLPSAWKDGTAFDGPASFAAFRQGLALAAYSAAAGEGAGGPPARLVVLTSSHGLHNPANALAADGAFGDRVTGSAMCLYESDPVARGERVSDKGFGDAFNAVVRDAEARHGVAIEAAILVDCSFCGGFADRPVQGLATTPVESAGLVGPGRVVEVGCSWVTECFGNPASTYYHMFTECTFTGRADGYGPGLAASGVPGSAGIPVPSAVHHARDGLVTVEEAYWCALESAASATAQGWEPTDPQQLYQLDDGLAGDLFAGDGFVLWDAGADQALRHADWMAPPPAAGTPPTDTEAIVITLVGEHEAHEGLATRDGSAWSFVPDAPLLSGAWTATAVHFEHGRPVAGPATVSFQVVVLDSDGDGVPDDRDAFPADPAEWADSDGDGVGDNGDACAGDDHADLDGDLVPDGCDADRDGDGCSNSIEETRGKDPDDATSVPKNCREPRGGRP